MRLQRALNNTRAFAEEREVDIIYIIERTIKNYR